MALPELKWEGNHSVHLMIPVMAADTAMFSSLNQSPSVSQLSIHSASSAA